MLHIMKVYEQSNDIDTNLGSVIKRQTSQTTIDYEWLRVTTSDYKWLKRQTTSDYEPDHELLQVTKSDYKSDYD